MGINVLLVDDSAVMRKIVSRSLRQSGVRIGKTREAGNGVEALESLAGASVDLVICAWNMPEMSGIDFVRAARKGDIETPIMMLTTEGSAERVSEALSAGANGYLTKPFTPEELGSKISIVLSL